MISRLIALAIFTVVSATELGLARAETVTVPDNFYIGNGLPFAEAGSLKYQQVYSASLLPGRMQISGMRFYIDSTGGPNSGFALGDYQVSLSTTAVAVGSLDPLDMSANLGSDDRIFFSGTLDGGSEIVGTPFDYDPSLGNLLLTVSVSGRSATCCFSEGVFWRAAAGTGTSRAWYTPDLVPLGFSLTGADDVGLVTTFTYRSVSEPSVLAVLGLGLAGLAALRRRSR